MSLSFSVPLTAALISACVGAIIFTQSTVCRSSPPSSQQPRKSSDDTLGVENTTQTDRKGIRKKVRTPYLFPYVGYLRLNAL